MNQKLFKGYVVVDDNHELVSRKVYLTEAQAKRSYRGKIIAPCTAYYWINKQP